MTDRSFFVSSRGELSIPTTLGHSEFRCQCGHLWELGQTSCPKCHGCTFTETYVPPTLLERIGGRIMAVTAPAKPEAPRASAAQVARLRAVQAAMAALLADLRALDGELIAAVRADVVELAAVQALVNTALSTTGDRSAQRVAGVSLGLESLADILGATINNLEDNPK